MENIERQYFCIVVVRFNKLKTTAGTTRRPDIYI